MSRAKPIMDADDMRESDWAIVEVLREGRANTPYIAERVTYTPQYIRERLGRLKEDCIVEQLGHGLYELNTENVPEREENDEG